MKKQGVQGFWLLVGQCLSHFDTSLYGFMAPFLAPLFFPHQDPVLSLLLTYSVLATGILGRPLGAYFFGVLASFGSPEKALKISFIGISVAMFLLGSLPSYDDYGFYSPLLLISARLLLDFFVSGERTVAALYLIHQKDNDTSFYWVGFYETAGVLGVLAASGASFVISTLSVAPSLWRWPFWLGASIGLLGLLFPYTSTGKAASPPPLPLGRQWKRLHRHIWNFRLDVVRVAFVSGFSYLTYAVPFVFLNAYMPQVSSISFEEMMKLNTLFLGVDLILPLFLGRFLKNFSAETIMKLSTMVLLGSFFLFFIFLDHISLLLMTPFRLWVILWGLIFSFPLTIWKWRLFPGEDCYLLSGLGSQLGSGLLGRNTPSILLAFIYLSGHSWGASVYIVVLGVLTLWALRTPLKTMTALDSGLTNLYLQQK